MTDSVHGKEKWRAAALAAVLAALLGHAALPGRAAPKPEPVKPAERKTEEAGGDKGERVVVQSREPGVWELPSNYRNADGSFNQQAIVAQQKMRLDEVNKRLMARMRLVETPHYLVFSDADDAMTGLFVKWCEALYSNLCRHFSIGPKEKTWDGKCILVVFNSRPLFQQFAKTFDDNDASRAGRLLRVGEPTAQRAATRPHLYSIGYERPQAAPGTVCARGHTRLLPVVSAGR